MSSNNSPLYLTLYVWDGLGMNWVSAESERWARKTQTFTEGKTMLLFYQHMDTLSFCVRVVGQCLGLGSAELYRRTNSSQALQLTAGYYFSRRSAGEGRGIRERFASNNYALQEALYSSGFSAL